MTDGKSIKISQVTAWILGVLITAGVGGFLAWVGNITDQVVELKIAQAQTNTLSKNLEIRIKEDIDVKNEIHELKSELRSLRTQSQINTNDLLSSQGRRFDMTDYDKYVRPVQADLLERVTRMEARIDN